MSWRAIKDSPRRLKKGRRGRRRRLKGAPGRGTWEKEKPPILGMLQRGGEVAIRLLDNVQQTTSAPLIRATIAVGTPVYTDEYDSYARWRDWGYEHSPGCHGREEYARDEDGDGFQEVHVKTIEGFWSLLRSWQRPHRGISRKSYPCTGDSSSSCPTPGYGAKGCSSLSSVCFWHS